MKSGNISPDSGIDNKSPEVRAAIKFEAAGPQEHDVPLPMRPTAPPSGFYGFSDMMMLADQNAPHGSAIQGIRSLDELLERDRLREEDGFPRKIRVGRLVKPGRGGKDKVVIVPTTVEEKFMHDQNFASKEGQSEEGGSGEGDEGEVIGEQPVHQTEGGGKGGAGQGEGGSHEIESSAYDLGKILTEKFELPNLKDKGKRRSLSRYTYDLTDRHRGTGQLLDKKATIRRVLETNLHLGNIPDVTAIDPTKLLVAPSDKVYRTFSKEKDWESQAMVFFVRDYSGSMAGIPTELVVSQHVMIYAWLNYQYERHIETRFILHDTEAQEVEDFYTYASSTVAGGTEIAAAYRLVNTIVSEEGLAKDYNIYVFHGTDGDDWDSNGEKTVPELETMLSYANRVGITVASRSSGGSIKTTVEKYLDASKLLENRAKELRLDVVPQDAEEKRLIEGIKHIISMAIGG